MSKALIPVIITVTQIASLIHLWYVYTYMEGHVPVAFMYLNLLALINGIILIFSYFSYSKNGKKQKLWLLPIGLAGVTIIMLITCYLVAGINKYQ